MSLFGLILGFTGTQEGMTELQKKEFTHLISKTDLIEFHHGDCIGADKDAHKIVRSVFPDCKIVIHPPINESKRAFCRADFEMPKLDYLDRNKEIVRGTDGIVATPRTLEEQLRSGTWSTVRYARSLKRPVHIIFPY